MATQDRKDTPTTAFEDQAVALAEQLGRIAGTIEGTAEQWLNREAIAEQVTRVRDSASQLIETLAGGAARGREAAATGAATMATVRTQVRDAASTAVSAAASAMSSLSASRARARKAVKRSSKKRRMDLAHAPGKKHRKPSPTVRGARKSDERIPKMRTAAAARRRRKSYA